MATTTPHKLSYKRFVQGELYQKNSVTLNHQRVYILPNKAGFAMLLLIALMLVASINYNNSMGFIFTFLLASAAQVSTFYSFKNLSALTVSTSRSAPFFLGEEGGYQLMLKELDDRERWNINIHINNNVYHLNRLGPLESKLIHIPIQANERGWFNAGTITLSSTFPLGIFRAWAPLKFKQNVLVYPAPLSIEEKLPLGNRHNPVGDALSQSPGVDEFVGLRRYQQGEAYRHINWKAWAAEKGLFVNQFNDQQTPEIWLDWFSCPTKQVEAKLSQLCQWVIDAEELGLQYGLRIPGQEIAPSRRIEHKRACLKALALYDA